MRRQADRCPICRKPTVPEYQPFCSKRCGDIDLGRWLGGGYAIPGKPLSRQDVEEAAGEDEDQEDP